jgi:choline-glycine betaine transporter
MFQMFINQDITALNLANIILALNCSTITLLSTISSVRMRHEERHYNEDTVLLVTKKTKKPSEVITTTPSKKETVMDNCKKKGDTLSC